MDAESVSRGTVRPMLFRREMRAANLQGIKRCTRRIVAANNSAVQPGAFAGLDLETGRARPLLHPELRARCTFESGRVRVVTVTPVVKVGDLFWEKTGRFGSRALSKMTLEVRAVGVGRVQDMSEHDAEEEGVDLVELPPKAAARVVNRRDRFAWLWDSINGKGSWAANPWVWIYRYQFHPLNIDDLLERWESRA